MVTVFKQYLAEEIAIDHADGIIGRREALRRLSMLGFGLPAATALLAACGGGGDEVASPPPATSGAPSASSAPAPRPGQTVATQAITFDGPRGRTLQGAWAPAATTPKGAVLVIHENRGLTDHIRSVAGRFAGSGFAALAIDLLSEEGGTASLGGDAEATAALAKVPPERFTADMRAGVAELARRAPGAKIGAVGFCFGGGMTWLLVASGEPRLAAAAPFYGPLPDNADFKDSKAAVLGIYAEQDQRVNASRGEARLALRRAGLTHTIVTYPGVDHAFFNDTGPRHNPNVARQAYQEVLNWFGRYLSA